MQNIVEQVFRVVINWSYEGIIQEVVILVSSLVVCMVHRCSIFSLFVKLSVSTLQDIHYLEMIILNPNN